MEGPRSGFVCSVCEAKGDNAAEAFHELFINGTTNDAGLWNQTLNVKFAPGISFIEVS